MGFKQTEKHRPGKASHHQIGLVRGQFGNIDEAAWLKFVADTGFDGWEEASWELDLRRCDSDAGAEAYAKQRHALAQKLARPFTSRRDEICMRVKQLRDSGLTWPKIAKEMQVSEGRMNSYRHSLARRQKAAERSDAAGADVVESPGMLKTT